MAGQVILLNEKIGVLDLAVRGIDQRLQEREKDQKLS
jgi:hypothetical protein